MAAEWIVTAFQVRIILFIYFLFSTDRREYLRITFPPANSLRQSET